MKTMRKILSMALLAFLTLGVAQAQTAESIARKYTDAIGGAANWKALKSVKQSIVLNTQGIDISGTVVVDASNRTRVDMTAMGTKIVQAHDGTTAWWINPFGGATQPTKMPAAEGKEFLAEEFLDKMIDWKKRGSTLTLLGEQTVSDRDCYKLKLVTKDQVETLYFIDKETSLLTMTRATSNAQGFKQTVESYYSDYAKEGNVMIAKKVTTKIGGVVARTTTVNSTEFNVATSDDMFAFPGN